MSVQVNGNNYNKYTYDTKTNATAATKEQEAAAKTEGEEKKSAQKADGFEKTTYTPDMNKVYSMKADMQSKMGAFKTMVQSMVQKQGAFADSSVSDLLEQLSGITREEAEFNISEDGEWGVEAVAQRLFEFAQALSGGDPSKAEMLRKAVQDGFKAAEQVLGGKLPDISQKTYDRTMELFDEWANGGKKAAEEAAEEVAAAD